MSQAVVIATLYRFVRLDDFERLREPLLAILLDNGLRGTLLLAAEGVNGTVAGSAAGIETLLAYLDSDPRLRGFDVKYSRDAELPFHRARVKLKREIVTMGIEEIDPENAGSYVEPAEWNRLIADPEVTLVDTRNDYEVAIGSFNGAVNPKTASFREFPAWAERELDPTRQRKLALFCTGGIRCEKATALLRQRGFDEVYHLRGGILNYLQEIPPEDSAWQGECFVFDNRVSVGRNLEKGSYDQCHACRRPITAQDKLSDLYLAGVSCPHCPDERSDAERDGLREREKQVRLARQRGEGHFGADATHHADRRKRRKLDAKAAQRLRAR